MSNKGYSKISRAEIPVNAAGETEVDIYIHLPSQDRYVRFFAKGDVLDQARLEKINSHVVPEIFVEELTIKAGPAKDKGPGSEIDYSQKKKIKIENLSEAETEVLSKEAETRIHDITQALLTSPMQDPAKTLGELENVTDEIIGLVAPDAKAVKEYLLQFTEHLTLMNNASAITTLSVMIAVANGFDSKKSYKELSFSALVMDVGLSGLSPEETTQYYIDAEALSPAAKEIVRNHPARSHQLAVEKLPSLSDATLQLILTHHELFNGRGYPRGVRTESLAPIMKVLPLAVDVFEFLKRAELTKQAATLLEAFIHFQNEAPEAHLRRHNRKLVDSCVKYLSEGKVPEENKKSA